jgi:hypothetical protein
MKRTCNKPACDREANATVTFDYPGLAAAIGPLSPSASALGTDLCSDHAQRLTVPDGWILVRHVESTRDF